MLDLHVHTCLSPCAELEMHPAAIAAAAREKGLDAIAVCDHNAIGNSAATMRAGRAVGLAVLPGMEIASEEEVHVLAWLPDAPSAERLQAVVHAALPGRNDPAVFGNQVMVDERGAVTGFEPRLLIGATTLGLERIVRAVHEERGLAVAAHVDRERFGLIGQLGFMPPGLPLDALETSRRTSLAEARARFGETGLPIVTGSDAHEPDALGAAVTFMLLDSPRLDEIRLALGDREGRAVLGGGRPMEDLSMHILDVARNAIEAGATRLDILVEERPDDDRLVIEMADNGRGMPAEDVSRASDPFFTTRKTRQVGLGLSLLSAAAGAAGGRLQIDSAPGRGTRVHATFVRSHVDRAPLGDLETTVLVLAIGSPQVAIRFRHVVGNQSFELDTAQVRASHAEPELASPAWITAVREAMRHGEAGLRSAAPAVKEVP